MFLFQKSIQGAVMILVIVLIRALLINKLPKRTFLVLWAAAVFCLLFPYSLESRFSVYSLMGKEGTILTGVPREGLPAGAPKEREGTETGTFTEADNRAMKENFTAGTEKLLEGQKEGTERTTGETDDPEKESRERTVEPGGFLKNGEKSGLWMGLWAAGAALCAGYFGMAAFRCRRVFAVSVPVKNEMADKWLAVHPLRRKITIRQSGSVPSPLTYGIFSPVILMPENTDWEKQKGCVGIQAEESGCADGGKVPGLAQELSLCLEHEFVHIKRLDGITKLVLTITLCLHWFNPAVWVMYILANRDLELSCDEAVVRLFGEHIKSVYAKTLIHMEEIKSSYQPLCSSFSKNAVEERITAIMKIKKLSLFTAAAGTFLVICITLVFATRAEGKEGGKAEHVKEFLGNAYTQEEAQMLADLWFEDYENMTVPDFQEKAWNLGDTWEYMDLIERLSNTAMEYEQKEKEEEADTFWEYFYYIYEPLTAEKWQNREFGGCVKKDLATKERPDFPEAVLEYYLTLSILNPRDLTVEEYNDTRLKVTEDLQKFWQERTLQELGDEGTIEEILAAGIKQIETKRSSEKLAVSVDYYFISTDIRNFLMDADEDKEAGERLGEVDPYGEENEREERQVPYGTKADYDSLLALRTPDYEKMTLGEFNDRLLDWCNHNPEAMERTGTDAWKENYQVELSEEEKRFVSLTVQLSRFENAAWVTSLQTGKPEEDPWWGGFDYMEAEGDMWCRLYFQFSYHISDKSRVTVGERDRCVEGMMARILKFWRETELEERIKLSEEEVARQFEIWAEECSSEAVTVNTDKDQIQYEALDERENTTGRQEYLGTVSTEGSLRYYISADAQEKKSKYFHLTTANHTEKEISSIAYTMLAYDEGGDPLELYWIFMDSSKPASHECTVEEQCIIAPGEIHDNEGGWSVCDLESPWGLIDLSRYGEDYRVAYVLSCIKQITFEDGTQWDNPDYEKWRAECCGKKVPWSALEKYSKQEYEISADFS